jgi:hypothetical protein
MNEDSEILIRCKKCCYSRYISSDEFSEKCLNCKGDVEKVNFDEL